MATVSHAIPAGSKIKENVAVKGYDTEAALKATTPVDGTIGVVKNIIRATTNSQTISGMTFSLNADESYTLNGTTTTPCGYVLENGARIENGKTYKIKGTGSATVQVAVNEMNGSADIQTFAAAGVNDAIFTAEYVDATHSAMIFIFVPAGVTLTNYRVAPCVVCADMDLSGKVMISANGTSGTGVGDVGIKDFEFRIGFPGYYPFLDADNVSGYFVPQNACCRAVGGSQIDAVGYLRSGGVWNPFVKPIMWNGGSAAYDFEDAGGYYYGGGSTGGTLTWRPDMLTCSCTGGHGAAFVSKNKIDVTRYKNLLVEFNVYIVGGAISQIGLYVDKHVGSDSSVVAGVGMNRPSEYSYVLDISAVTGSYYLGFGAYSSGTSYAMDIRRIALY